MKRWILGAWLAAQVNGCLPGIMSTVDIAEPHFQARVQCALARQR